jgi:hypothetical protein
MTLKEKFEPYVIRYTQDDVVGYLPEEIPILEYQEQCEKIADEFAIGFAEWLLAKELGYVTFQIKDGILETYKKEQGL